MLVFIGTLPQIQPIWVDILSHKTSLMKNLWTAKNVFVEWNFRILLFSIDTRKTNHKSFIVNHQIFFLMTPLKIVLKLFDLPFFKKTFFQTILKRLFIKFKWSLLQIYRIAKTCFHLLGVQKKSKIYFVKCSSVMHLKLYNHKPHID